MMRNYYGIQKVDSLMNEYCLLNSGIKPESMILIDFKQYISIHDN
jgi:hypothetical protein